MSVLQDSAKPGRYGYSPHDKYSTVIVLDEEVLFNIVSDRKAFQKKFNKSLPDWWPRLPNGKIVTHVYRVLAVEDGGDLRHPRNMRSAIRHKLVQNKLVDFTDIDIKKQAIRHVNGRYDERLFVSTSLDLNSLCLFGKRQRGLNPEYVRIDLLALWEDGLFTETSFADVSTEGKFKAYFFGDGNTRSGLNSDWIDDQDIDHRLCRKACCALREVLIGLRGPWWPAYAVLINENDQILLHQAGGYKRTIFGDVLRNKFEGRPLSIKSHRKPVHPPKKANCKPTRNNVVPPGSHRAKSEPRMPPPQHPGNSKQVVPSGRMNQVVPPWRTEKRPSAVLTPARGISPKAGSPPPSPIV